MATLIHTDCRGLKKRHVSPHCRPREAHLHKDAELELEGYRRFEVETPPPCDITEEAHRQPFSRHGMSPECSEQQQVGSVSV